uniref:Pentatricopeptide repeat-containing protein At4g21065-like n=1 Tax=Rhizophora mucronata TaxID=61149 RepID=A0A2P2PLF6_RHIMU
MKLGLAKFETIMSLVRRCSCMTDLKQLHAVIIQAGFEQNLFLTGKLIEFCAVSERGDLDYAVSVFGTIGNPDGFLWNTMIRGFGKASEPHKAFDYYQRMQLNELVADSFTFSFLIKVSGQLGSVALGKQMHCSALKHGFASHVFVRNNLVHMYGLVRDIEPCRQLFEEIPSPDLVAWNTLINCHVYCGLYKEALDMFLRMSRIGLEPDGVTLVVILTACSALGALHFGRWIHSCISNTSLESIVKVNNSLIHMYAKCGALEEALKIFNTVKKKDIVTWNNTILGLAANGRANEALQLFSQLLQHPLVKPDSATFLAVLCACSHGGMVDRGRRIFDSMIKDHHIQPTIKHYGCMADILGRAGFLDEAYQLLSNMPMEHNAVVWRTLLAACSLHGDVELGEQVMKHLLELEPGNSSDYVLLSNTYASLGQWDEMMAVRKSMLKKGVQKHAPGNSFIGMYPSPSSEMELTRNCNKARNIYEATSGNGFTVSFDSAD